MAEKIAELRIKEIEDRQKLASILVKNGYGVIPGKRKKTQTSRALDYYITIYGGNSDSETEG